jgi:hypothetical protein
MELFFDLPYFQENLGFFVFYEASSAKKKLDSFMRFVFEGKKLPR